MRTQELKLELLKTHNDSNFDFKKPDYADRLHETSNAWRKSLRNHNEFRTTSMRDTVRASTELSGGLPEIKAGSS